MSEETVKRCDIFYADLSPVVGSEQGGTRPVLIVQNDTGNRHSPTVIAAAITSQTGKARLPTHINIAGGSVGLSKDSVILLEQIRTIDGKEYHLDGHGEHCVVSWLHEETGQTCRAKVASKWRTVRLIPEADVLHAVNTPILWIV